MASSSSAPAPKPSPYEVFLSFRGGDTRLTFVSHLRGALQRRGIITFYDDTELRLGDTLSTELVEAIQESSIAVVVLSKNYASSTWCLRELLKIVECMNENKLQIYPIFYDVDPSDVRKQQRSFLEAFKDHEVNFKDNMEMVNAWRKALTEVSNLKGVDVRGKYEEFIINNVADEILRKLPVKVSDFVKSLVGIESRVSQIKRLVYSHPNEVRFIGIWGMGGVGKTTTARAIFEACKSQFKGSCFLQDVSLKKNEMEKLQNQLLSQILKTDIKGIHDVIDGSSMIQERLRFKRVLLVIDDVDNIHQLKVLAGEWYWFGKGSRIIITTRDAHLLSDVHEKYTVDTLPDSEAMRLFFDHAFKNEQPDEDYIELSHKVLSYAGGLPLALEVFGDHLYKQEKWFWQDTLSRLQEVPEAQIISKLEISFNGLNDLHQDIFLDIACFFRVRNRDDMIECLRTLYRNPKEGISVLVQKSLIRESIFNNEIFLEVHDLLQDMGWHIVRKRANRDVRRYSRLWLEEDILTVLSDYKGSAEAEGLIIEGRFYDNSLKFLNEKSFMNMNRLRFLQINEYGGRKAGGTVFKSSVHLPNGLRWLYWSGYPGNFLGKSFFPRNLVRLEMMYSLIEITPDFSHMPNLEVLDLRQSDKLVHIHPSLGHHMKIKRINLECCSELEEFPRIIRMNSVEYLNLSHTGLQSFPEICENVDLLEELYFNGTYIRGLPISIQYASFIRMLKFGWMDDETTELESLSSFKYLQSLSIDAPSRLTTVPELPSSLRTLQMRRCPALKEYPKSFPNLLETLEITGSSIERTPDFSHLPYLSKLDLSRSSLLSEVHASLGVHKMIVLIYLIDCINLQEFPRIVDMESLKELDLSGTGLRCFPEIRGNVSNLEDLNLEGTSIRTFPESIRRATGLTRLNTKPCGSLVSIPINRRSLEKLVIFPVATKLHSPKGRKETDYRVKGKFNNSDLEAVIAPKVSVEVINARTVDGQKVARTDSENAIVPNARAFLLKGNVILIFVSIVVLVVAMVPLRFIVKLVKNMNAGIPGRTDNQIAGWAT